MKTRLEKMQEFYNSLNIDHLDVAGYANENHQNYDDICEAINCNGGFDIEIIYYSEAMKYLTANDTSLRTSLGLAGDMGFEPASLNSEILASLLASENVRAEFAGLENDINEFFEELNEETEN